VTAATALAAVFALAITVSGSSPTVAVHPARRAPTASTDCGKVSATYVPSCGAWFGTTGAPDLATAEGVAGRTADIFRQYKTFASYAGTKPFPGDAAQAAIDSGHMYFFSWKPKLADGGVVSWASVADGAMDAAYVEVLARKIRSWSETHGGKKVFMAFHHEPENDVGVYGSTADYVRAWRHINDRFVALGARSAVIFVWVMSGYRSRVHLWNSLYPGDDVVDWIGWDPYGRTQYTPATASVVPFLSALGEDQGTSPDSTGWYRFYKWATGIGAQDSGSGQILAKAGSHTKPIMVAEFGVCWNTDTLSQATHWYVDAAASIDANRYPLVKAFTYFNVYECFQPTGSAAMKANFRAAVSVSRLRPTRPY
jgi:hypothetical protein